MKTSTIKNFDICIQNRTERLSQILDSFSLSEDEKKTKVIIDYQSNSILEYFKFNYQIKPQSTGKQLVLNKQH